MGVDSRCVRMDTEDMRLVAVGLALLLSACTKQNPSACGDGVCNDPALPFCDTQGTLGGAVNECIAVACTPGEFAECRGEVSVVCNETGDNYELIECVRGCDDATGGCHIDPSNDLGQYFDMVPDPPDIEIASGAIDTYTGVIAGLNDVPTFLVAAPPGGAAIRVFVGRRVRLGDVDVSPSFGNSNPALAILATESITVEGTLRFAIGALYSAGEIFDDACRGGESVAGENRDGTTGEVLHSYCSGRGGGGHASTGAPGGSVIAGGPGFDAVGGRGGAASGTDDLIPLRGGCRSGGGPAGHGGGAVQLTSMGFVRVIGTIDVRGESGGVGSTAICTAGNGANGGGGGGGVLLEAPTVELADSATVVAGGGGGASRVSAGANNYPGPMAGGSCDADACGAGGSGAAAGVEPTEGQSVVPDLSEYYWTGGGGGGGIGRLRVNTTGGMYSRGTSTVEDVRVTSGTIRRK